jgi:regulator of sirC expression with transglutaminase-like and TPR domain
MKEEEQRSMHLAVHVTARFFDHVVEEVVSAAGTRLVLGPSSLSIPMPAEQAWYARIDWRTPATAAVTLPDGKVELLDRDNLVEIQEGPVTLELRLVRRFGLRRMADLATIAASSLGVLLIFISLYGTLGLVPGQLGTGWRVVCGTWLRGTPPVLVSGLCPLQEDEGGGRGIPGNRGSPDRYAEYLERILKKDFDGEEEGVLEIGDRQYGQREQKDIYLPAGGPSDDEVGRMGGAQDEGLRPKRTEPAKAEKKPENLDAPLTAPPDVGTPVPQQSLPVDLSVANADDPAETTGSTEQVQEDRTGWGVRDWYDQRAQEQDEREIEVMTGMSKRVLRIDPDDPTALQTLAYYQYLNSDLEGSETTYNRFIELYPEDPAGYNNVALVYKRRGEYLKEEQYYQVALQLRPDDVTALNNLAVNYAHQKRFDEALEVMRRLETLDPDEPYADLHRAKIYAEMGDQAKALEFLERALVGMKKLSTLHHIEFRQDIRVDPSFEALRETREFRSLLWRYYGDDTPLPE